MRQLTPKREGDGKRMAVCDVGVVVSVKSITCKNGGVIRVVGRETREIPVGMVGGNGKGGRAIYTKHHKG